MLAVLDCDDELVTLADTVTVRDCESVEDSEGVRESVTVAVAEELGVEVGDIVRVPVELLVSVELGDCDCEGVGVRDEDRVGTWLVDWVVVWLEVAVFDGVAACDVVFVPL